MRLLPRRYPEVPLTGAVVAITGAGRGIGRATAEAFARRGAKVAIGDLDTSAALDAMDAIGRGCRAFTLDVTSRESFVRFLDEVTAELGPIDILVNNAGIMPAAAFLDETDQVSRTQVEVNLLGPITGMRLVAPGMIARGRGHIVNIASMAGKLPIPGLAVYCGSKFGVVGLSSAVRAELSGTGVSVTTVLPSAVRTGLVAGIELGKGLPTVNPEDIAAAVIRSVRTRAAEMSVPGWVRPLGPIAALLPESVVRAARALIGSDRALHADGVARAEYDKRISDQAGT